MLLVDDLAAGGTKNLRHTPRGLVTLYTELLKKPDTFHLLQTCKYQIKELSRYAYFNNETLESILRKNIFIKYRT